MERSTRRTVTGLIVTAVSCLALAGTAPAQENTPQAESRPRCSEATLAGKYAVRGDGFLSSGPPPAPLVPFAVVSVMTMDGHGGLSNQVSASFNGQIRQNTVFGRYTVDDDCTGTITVTLAE